MEKLGISLGYLNIPDLKLHHRVHPVVCLGV